MDFRQINKNLQREFSVKKMRAESIAARNFAWVNSVPAFVKLTKIEKELALEISKQKVAGKDCKDLQKIIADARDKKKKILAKMNLKESDLVPQYECKKCSDTGVVNGYICSCYKKRRNEELGKAFGIEISKQKTFKNFSTKICKNESQAKELESLKTKLEKWVQDYPDVKKTKILFTGKTGLGKTYLTECLANAFLEKGNSVCFVSAFEMVNCFLKYHTSFEKDKYSWIEPFVESDVLIIDDLGTEPKLKNVTLEYLYLVISEREKYSRPIIVTTNFESGNILDIYGERIYSRLINKQTSATFKMIGDDLRVSK